jgi:hypothetical protein
LAERFALGDQHFADEEQRLEEEERIYDEGE